MEINLREGTLSTLKNRVWAIWGFEYTETIVDGHKTIIADFKVAGQKVQYVLAVPNKAFVQFEPSEEERDRPEKWFYIQENTLIQHRLLRPIHLGFIDTSDKSLPAEITATDLGRGMTVHAIPAS